MRSIYEKDGDVEILKVRCFKAGYVVQTEKVVFQGSEVVMQVAYTPRGDYIGDAKMARRLVVKRGIAPEKIQPESMTCTVGYCREDGCWYGWSHRASFGFKAGSKVKRGDCGFLTTDPEELKKELRKVYPNDGKHYRKVRMHYNSVDKFVGVYLEEARRPQRLIKRGKRKGEYVPDGPVIWKRLNYRHSLGRGEWTAKDIVDARQMAVDFARSVS